MNRYNMSKRAIIVESIIVFVAIIYAALQIIYGIRYHIPPVKYFVNIFAVAAVYSIETYLYFQPWKINRITREECTGDVKKYSQHMTQAVKLVFNLGLLVPCVFDLLAIELKEGFSIILVILLLLIVGLYEYKIIKAMHDR